MLISEWFSAGKKRGEELIRWGTVCSIRTGRPNTLVLFGMSSIGRRWKSDSVLREYLGNDRMKMQKFVAKAEIHLLLIYHVVSGLYEEHQLIFFLL